jgi:hypothetical protein
VVYRDKGHYAAKHPGETRIDEQIAALIRDSSENQAITCSDAVAIASATGKTILEVGVNLDLLEIRITLCQLGLFGFSRDKRAIQPAESVDRDLKKVIEANLQEGRLSCEGIWKIAGQLNLPRMVVSEACEALKIKIKPCQLGAF